MNSSNFFKDYFESLPLVDIKSDLENIRQKAMTDFREKGIPDSKLEDWKYTRIAPIFEKDYEFTKQPNYIHEDILKSIRLPGHEQCNELFFINGFFSEKYSSIFSEDLIVQPLEEASQNEFKNIVSNHLGKSSKYSQDGIHALNTAFVHGGVFIQTKKGTSVLHPVYIYNLMDARIANIFSQPRSLVHVCESTNMQIVETYATLGFGESFTNQVMEIVVEKDATLEYYKIQNDAIHTNQISTTNIRQVGKSIVHAVTISLNGNIVRNNLHVILEAANSEAHLFGLYFAEGKTHIDNRTIVDNVKPNSFSNELYKGILKDNATGVFNGKIYVRKDAQKTNAYQSNKNILLSDTCSVNAKPQLEIFADDVKCSHGCTVGRLDEEGLFYLQSRGINENIARSLLIHAFAIEILNRIKIIRVRNYIDQLISKRLKFDIT